MDIVFYKYLLFLIEFIVAFFIILKVYLGSIKSLYFEKFLLNFFVILFLLVFTFRNVNPDSDTDVYLMYFNSKELLIDSILNGKDIFFYFITLFIGFIYQNDIFYLFVLACLFLIPLRLAIVKSNIKYGFLYFTFITTFFFFVSMGENVLRQGIGYSFFMLGYTYSLQNRFKLRNIFFLLSIGFHASLAFPVFFFFLVRKYHNIIVYLVIYILCAFLSLINLDLIEIFVKLPIVGGVFDTRVSNYQTEILDYVVGFRLDFFLYNTLFLVLSLFVLERIREKWYKDIVLQYICLSSVFFMMFTQPYSDRYGVLSWMFIPFMFVPFLNDVRLKVGILNILSIYVFSLILFVFFIFK